RQVLAGLEAASSAGFAMIKVNTVLFRGLNEDEAPEFVKFSREHGYVQRFIELMPFRLSQSKGVTGEEVRSIITAAGLPVDGLEFINQMTHPFCSDCARLRLDSRGRLKTCLLSHRT
ncbi:MAG: GTP 3',8-cyclase MoaA, partial [Myxococcota bacterium]